MKRKLHQKMKNLSLALRFSAKNRRVRAFTLLECVIALVLLPCILLIFVNIGEVITRQEEKWSNQEAKSWQLFVTQMENRCRLSRNLQILQSGEEFQFSYWAIEERGKGKNNPVIERFYLNKKGEIVKTNENKRGFEPVLTGVQMIHAEKKQQNLTLEVEFSSGKKEQAIWEVKDELWSLPS